MSATDRTPEKTPVANLLEAQVEIFQRLNKLWRNLRKLPLDKRTSKYVYPFVTQTTLSWDQFKRNHEILKSSAQPPPGLDESYGDSLLVVQSICSKIKVFCPGLDTGGLPVMATSDDAAEDEGHDEASGGAPLGGADAFDPPVWPSEGFVPAYGDQPPATIQLPFVRSNVNRTLFTTAQNNDQPGIGVAENNNVLPNPSVEEQRVDDRQRQRPLEVDSRYCFPDKPYAPPVDRSREFVPHTMNHLPGAGYRSAYPPGSGAQGFWPQTMGSVPGFDGRSWYYPNIGLPPYAANPPNNPRGLRVADLKLKKFDGKFSEYRNFKNSFERMHDDYQTHEKFEYLRLKLDGKAFAAIEHLENIDANYAKAWAILDRKFNNARFQLESNLEKLVYDLPMASEYVIETVEQLQQSAIGLWSNLEGLEISWKDMFTYFVSQRLEKQLRTKFYATLDAGKVATGDELFEFLEQIQQAHQVSGRERFQNRTQAENQKRSGREAGRHKPRTLAHATVTDSPSTEKPGAKQAIKCFICAEAHAVVECKQFLNAADREAKLKEHKICIYCLRHKYDYRAPCRSKDLLKCETCGKNHIKEMHPPQLTTTNCAQSSGQSTDRLATKASEVVLPTAVLEICGKQETLFHARAMIDQCSQSSYITEHLAHMLKLPRTAANAIVIGVGGSRTPVKHKVSLHIRVHKDEVADLVVKKAPIVTKDSHSFLKVEAFVVPKITENFSKSSGLCSQFPTDLKLADPDFKKAASIKVLLGGAVYALILKDGIDRLNGYLLQNSVFGWLVSGPCSGVPGSIIATNISLIESDQRVWAELEERILKFWEMPKPAPELNPSESDFCETLFKDQQYRDAEGRYVVPTPWKPEAPAFGETYKRAYKFYLGQEYRWYRNAVHKAKSDEFMKEYLAEGHMTKIPFGETKVQDGKVFYLPYISIIRHDAVTTKLRNVFNGSAESSNGVTLNSCIHPGPTLQTRITDVITKLRQHRFMYCADITKAFRQILLRPEDASRLRILWRENRSQPIEEFQLNTVTYGLDCAPWQTIRTIHQIALDNANDEETASIITSCFYMDDLACGADTIADCRRQIANVSNALNAGKMPLTKWMSNDQRVLEDIPQEKRMSAFVSQAEDSPPAKLLGLRYDPASDCFAINIKTPSRLVYTKRGLLSASASIYDPLGWILPVVMRLRILLQGLWRAKYDWDDRISTEHEVPFTKCFNNCGTLSRIQFPRWTGESPAHVRTSEFIGFCDASGDGYAAVLYCRTKVNDDWRIILIAATAHVVPIKGKVGTKAAKEHEPKEVNATTEDSKTKISNDLTIPKLELEAIKMLCELYKTHSANFSGIRSFTAYTDSEIALAWVRSPKDSDNRFVKRRVNSIRKVLAPAQLNYVKSKENPADLPSRGTDADQLLVNQLWFEGPVWLKCDVLPFTPFFKAQEVFALATVQSTENCNLLERYSDWTKLQRVTSTMLRWKFITDKTTVSRADLMAEAKIRILRFYQTSRFPTEIKALQAGKKLPKRNAFASLTAFIDGKGLVRAGGRLARGDLEYDAIHPIILPKGHVTELIVKHLHNDYGHAGNRQLASIVQETFYIPALHPTIQRCIRRCLICLRWKGLTTQPIMSDLPRERICRQPNFNSISIDLAGPFLVKASRIRSDRHIKVWVAVFVCMLSKAVHLEVCCDLTTGEFFAAFMRFTSRRGMPSHILSDNQTNFVLACKLIKQAWTNVKDELREKLSLLEIKWVFSPPRSPSFNGLAEAMVKTFKYFLNRLANSETLRYDEFLTVICRIEGFINTRPLTAHPQEPGSPSALTPFLLIQQRQMKPFILDEVVPTANQLSKRFHMMQVLQQELWRRFSSEYITQLRKRYKWQVETRKAQVGDVVLIKDLDTRPNQWPLGVIIKVLPDESGHVRRVEIRTADKIVPRAVEKLVPLIDDDGELDPEEGLHVAETIHDNDDLIPEVLDQSKSAPVEPVEEPQLTPRAPDLRHNDVPIRRSKRIQDKTAILTRVLLCWLTFAQVAKDARAFNPGSPRDTFFVESSQNVSLKLFDFRYDVATGVSVTADLNFMTTETTNFRAFCDKNAAVNPANITTHCRHTHLGVAKLLTLLTTEIKSQYDEHRSRRSVPALLLSVAGKVAPSLVKSIPHVAVAATVGYSLYDNKKTRDQLQDLRSHQHRLTDLTLQLGNLDHDQFEGDVGKLFNIQRELQLANEITDYATSLQVTLQTLAAKHRNLARFEIPPEMTTKLNFLRSNYEEVTLPVNCSDDQLLRFYPSTKSIINHMAVVHFRIPMVQRRLLQKVTVASLQMNHKINAVMSGDGDSFALPVNTKELQNGVISKVRFEPIIPCLKLVLGLNSSTSCSEDELRELVALALSPLSGGEGMTSPISPNDVQPQPLMVFQLHGTGRDNNNQHEREAIKRKIAEEMAKYQPGQTTAVQTGIPVVYYIIGVAVIVTSIGLIIVIWIYLLKRRFPQDDTGDDPIELTPAWVVRWKKGVDAVKLETPM